MYSVLSELYSLGESLFSSVDMFSDIFFYELFDKYSLMSVLLPSAFLAYMGYQMVKWFLDIVL